MDPLQDIKCATEFGSSQKPENDASTEPDLSQERGKRVMHEKAHTPSCQDIPEGRMNLNMQFWASAETNARKVTYQCGAGINLKKCITQVQIFKYQSKTIPTQILHNKVSLIIS